MLSSKDGIKALCNAYFYDDKGQDLELTDYQAEIIKRLVLKKPKRNLLWATTRAGKSFALAIGAILVAMLRPGEKIKLVGPTQKHSKIIMNYVLDHVSDDDDIVTSLTAGRGKNRADKLREELSKERITFENNSEIEILSASVNSGGRQLLGKGGSIVIVDEAEQIPTEIVRTRILRMIGDRPKAQLFLISNPTFPDNRGFMWEVKQRQAEYREEAKGLDDPEKVAEVKSQITWDERVIGWEEAVEAGRMTEQFIEEERRNLTEGEFKILYDAKYPEEVEGGLIRADWFRRAERQEFDEYNMMNVQVFAGQDVAEAGRDKSVLTVTLKGQRFERVKKEDGTTEKQPVGEPVFKVRLVKDWDLADTEVLAERIMEHTDADEIELMNVDSIGVGRGVADKLKREGYNVNICKVSENAPTDPDRFSNKKAEYFWKLREVFKEGRIDVPEGSEIRGELLAMRYDHVKQYGSEKIKIIDPDKSPDFADSLMLSLVDRNDSDNFSIGVA